MNQTETCYACGGEALLVQAPRRVKVGRRKVSIVDDFMQCRGCGEEYYLPGQMQRSQERASGALQSERCSLTPGDIFALRESMALTQAEAERLVGVGAKTWVRWERGTVRPNAATDLILRVLRDVPGASAYLAGLNKVSLPERATQPRAEWSQIAADLLFDAPEPDGLGTLASFYASSVPSAAGAGNCSAPPTFEREKFIRAAIDEVFCLPAEEVMNV
jgi:putative zinc finger/helix-turn-helix YgiT family protein